MSAAVYVLSTVTGYVLTSALLLKWPSLLHRRKKEAFRSRHISHRGGEWPHYSTSIMKFIFFYFSVHIFTQISVHLFTQLKSKTDAHVVLVFQPLYKRFRYVLYTFNGGDDKRIPLLRDVFEAFPNTPINIDIKVNNDTLIKKNPQIPILFSLPRVLLLLGLFYTGLLPFVPLKEQFLEIPIVVNILEFRYECIFRLLMRKALFDHLTSRGIQVCVWVLNDEEDFKRAFDLGATGIMTDYPTKLKEFMEKKQLHS
uniref:Glycerophosphodiester phosphodiesterase domain-containing protein 1-like n=1 Tax=Sinocyclocheilus rhinocerous TaxID=307959 RepID=A0A673KK01_9TELE